VTIKARRIGCVAAALAMAALAGLRVWPHPPLRASFALSTAVWSADGRLLRVTRAADDQYRLWVSLDRVSPTLVDASLLKEDRWFYWHPGVNPYALARAAFRTYAGGGRQGGSTVTMQVARLGWRLNTRTPAGKLRQVALALWLEARYSKREILEAFLNVAPFGGNLQGVAAASLVCFGKPPDRVTLGEALALAVVPQHPSSRAGRRLDEAAALAARARLGAAWLARRGGAEEDRRQIALPIVARHEHPLPWNAPHAVDAALAIRPARTGHVETTIDSGLQELVEQQIRRYVGRHGDAGINNAAALLIDTRDMAARAWAGSADFWSESIHGQVDGVLAKRSPGSALKPFVYALALDQGVLHPQTVLRDAPTSFGSYSPENYDGRFAGPIPAEEALIRSRNVPALWVDAQLRQPTFYQFLRSAGIRGLKPESFYGLGLALGGGEVSMEEVAGLYAMLASGGVLRPVRLLASAPAVEGVRLLSPEASFVTLDMLRRTPRPGETGTVRRRSEWPVAWKTGTSWGFRDAWSAGVVGPYVLVVWIGDFDGGGNPAFVGIDAAAPLFFAIADAVNLSRPDEAMPAVTPPPGVARVEVCAGSGDLPNRDCPRTVDTWYIPGKSPIRVSQLHRALAIDPHTGRPACPPYPAGTRFDVYEFWPSDMLQLFREAGMPRRTPPALPACAQGGRDDQPRILSPLRNVTYALDQPSSRGQVFLDASVAADVRRVFWFDGRALISAHDVADGPLAWRPTMGGTRTVRVVDDHGRSAERDVTIQIERASAGAPAGGP
jgi:penicillin-binding protein 1C